MGVYIKGMEMPKEGHLIIRIYASGEVCEPTECAGVWGKVATAVPVPPHGRLIDADALMNCIRTHDYPLTAYFNSTDNGMFTIGIQQAVDEAPTIIPAEEGKT